MERDVRRVNGGIRVGDNGVAAFFCESREEEEEGEEEEGTTCRIKRASLRLFLFLILCNMSA